MVDVRTDWDKMNYATIIKFNLIKDNIFGLEWGDTIAPMKTSVNIKDVHFVIPEDGYVKNRKYEESYPSDRSLNRENLLNITNKENIHLYKSCMSSNFNDKDIKYYNSYIISNDKSKCMTLREAVNDTLLKLTEQDNKPLVIEKNNEYYFYKNGNICKKDLKNTDITRDLRTTRGDDNILENKFTTELLDSVNLLEKDIEKKHESNIFIKLIKFLYMINNIKTYTGKNIEETEGIIKFKNRILNAISNYYNIQMDIVGKIYDNILLFVKAIKQFINLLAEEYLVYTSEEIFTMPESRDLKNGKKELEEIIKNINEKELFSYIFNLMINKYIQ